MLKTINEKEFLNISV